MTKVTRTTPTIPRRTVMGERWFDMRDLGAVLDHEEPLPHPVGDQVQ
jgi:hypothetical protein